MHPAKNPIAGAAHTMKTMLQKAANTKNQWYTVLKVRAMQEKKGERWWEGGGRKSRGRGGGGGGGGNGNPPHQPRKKKAPKG